MNRIGRMNRLSAFTLVEAVVSIVVVGLMLVAALNAVGMSRMSEYRIADRSRGLLLAEELMTEILQLAYADPDTGLGSFGLSAAERAMGSRKPFNDVDDYDDWSASPPVAKDGTLLVGYEGWTREVTVDWVDPHSPQQVIAGDRGVKSITVRVKHNEREVASLVAIRTSVWPVMSPQ